MMVADRVWARLRPAEGRWVFVLALSAVLITVWGARVAQWVTGDELLWHAALVSFFLSRALWGRKNSGWRTGVALAVAGLAYVTWWATQLLTPTGIVIWAVLHRDHKVAATWLGEAQVRLAHLGRGLTDLVTSPRNRTVGVDPLVVLFLMAVLLWLAVAVATWGLSRRRHPLVAFLPLCTLLATSAYVGNKGQWQLLAFAANLVAMTPLVMVERAADEYRVRRAAWSADLRNDVVLIAAIAWIGYILITAPFPNVSYWPIVERFWDTVQGRDRAEEEARRRLAFSSAQFPAYGVLAGLGPATQLPRAHLLGTGDELEKIEVMLVATDDLPPVETTPAAVTDTVQAGQVSYWRGTTHSEYTGSGWHQRPWSLTRIPGYGALASPDVLGRRQLRQTVTMLLEYGSYVFAANEPQSVDQPVVKRWLADENDITELEADLSEYQVVSLVPRVSAKQLFWAGTRYPASIFREYLRLPVLPSRVVDLARSVAANYQTAYPQVAAIEAFLRKYPYDLKVPKPPADRDVVDYFLFDLQRGYCDYFATAMVVMCRAIGVPARLAVGYSMGHYDEARKAYVVTAKNAHSWPEVYFPEYGWIPFEPTSGLAPLARAPDDQGPENASSPPPKPGRSWWVIARIELQVLWVHRKGELFLAGAGLLGLFAAWCWWNRGLWGRDARHRAIVVYQRMCELAPRLGVDVRTSDTPAEVGAAVLRSLAKRSPRWKWSTRRVEAELAAALDEVPVVAGTYETLTYSRTGPGDAALSQAAQKGRLLRGRLWWLWFLSSMA